MRDRELNPRAGSEPAFFFTSIPEVQFASLMGNFLSIYTLACFCPRAQGGSSRMIL